MTARLTAISRQRVPFAPGGPVRAMQRGDVITLVGLGPDNVDTQWADLHADGSLAGPFSLPFAVEHAASDGESLVLSGNEPGSDSAVVLVVDADRTVTTREVFEGGTLTRWPIPVAVTGGTALVWESTDGLWWSAAGQEPTRIAEPGGTNALVVAAIHREQRVAIARSTVDGSAEVAVPPDGSWRRVPIDGWVETVDITPWAGKCAVAATRRGERRLSIASLDAGLDVRTIGAIDVPGAGPLLSSTVRICALGEELVVLWSATSRVRAAGGRTTTVDEQMIAVLDRSLAGAGDVDWLTLDPAGSLHHSLATDGSDRVVAVHGRDDAYVTELVVGR